MNFRLEVDLVGAEVHLGPDGDEIGTATFKKWGSGEGDFTVEATADLATRLMKSAGSRFVIFIEPIMTAAAWTFSLVSAVAVPSISDPVTK